MIIGTIKEVKDNENRVGLTPHHTKELVSSGHTVLVEKGAGVGADYSDSSYKEAGAQLLDTPLDVASKVDILVKVKEPTANEYDVLSAMKGKTLYTYLHLAAAEKSLIEQLLEHSITSIAYETIEDKDGSLPCLRPMSKVAGILSIQYASQYLQKKYGGRGLSLGHIRGADVANVVIIGGGVVGKKAALTAAGMGSKVTVFEAGEKRANYVRDRCSEILSGKFFSNLDVVVSTPELLAQKVKEADVLVGAVLIPGAKAPRIVTKDMVDFMRKGAVIIDVAIDQGGCIWGSRPTSHSKPLYNYEGKLYCCITNMPGQVAHQSTQALTSETFPYLLSLVNKGIVNALKEDAGLLKGVNTHNGHIVYEDVAKAHDMKYKRIEL